MQLAQAKFKDDSNIQFLFVDTWERVDDKAKAAGDFINSKGYPFHVLLDLEDKVVASYGVSGIPTKFVVDKSGKIRFKSIGYSGSTDALVDELTAMIELAKEQP
jgi:peroxiredoxin